LGVADVVCVMAFGLRCVGSCTVNAGGRPAFKLLIQWELWRRLFQGMWAEQDNVASGTRWALVLRSTSQVPGSD
jgi:hypothetical protein